MKYVKELILLLIFSLVIRLFLFTPELYSWDSGEYGVSVANSLLPHDNYFMYLLIGKLFSLFFETDFALSLMSLVFDLGSIIIFFFIIKKGFSERFAIYSTSIFAFLPINVMFASFQEIYAVQSFFILLTIFFLFYDNVKHSKLWSGISFGVATTIHYSSIVILPFIIVGLLFKYFKFSKKRLLLFLLGFSVIFIPVNLFVVTRYSSISDGLQYAFNFLYTGTDFSALQSFDTMKELFNIQSFLINLSYSQWFVLMALLGFVLLTVRDVKKGFFWIMFSLPFMAGVFFKGGQTDWGVYSVFLSPVIAISIYSLFNTKWIKMLLVGVTIIFFVNLCLTSDLYKFNSDNYEVYSFIKNNTNQEDYIIDTGNPWVLNYYTERNWIHASQNLWVFNNTGVWGSVNNWVLLNQTGILELFENHKVYALFDHKNMLSYWNGTILNSTLCYKQDHYMLYQLFLANTTSPLC